MGDEETSKKRKDSEMYTREELERLEEEYRRSGAIPRSSRLSRTPPKIGKKARLLDLEDDREQLNKSMEMVEMESSLEKEKIASALEDLEREKEMLEKQLQDEGDGSEKDTERNGDRNKEVEDSDYENRNNERSEGGNSQDGSRKDGSIEIEDSNQGDLVLGGGMSSVIDRINSLVDEINSATSKVNKGKIVFNLEHVGKVKDAVGELSGIILRIVAENVSLREQVAGLKKINELMKVKGGEEGQMVKDTREKRDWQSEWARGWEARDSNKTEDTRQKAMQIREWFNANERIREGGDRRNGDNSDEESIMREKVRQMEEWKLNSRRKGSNRSMDREDQRERLTGYDSGTDVEGLGKNREVIKKRTYADIAKVVERRKEVEKRRMEKRTEGWKTPPEGGKVDNWSILILGEERTVEESKRLLGNVKSELLKGGIREVKDLRPTRTGSVLIDCGSREIYGKVERLARMKEWRMKGGESARRPILKITGVEKGREERELIEGLMMENEEVKEYVDKGGLLKVVTRRPCRNEYKENIMMEMEGELFRTLMKKKVVYLDLTVKWVEEYIGVQMCYKCARFGHSAKVCKEKSECYKCGGEHEGRECKNDEWDCVNCKKNGIVRKYRAHLARDTKCPVFMKKLKEYRNTIVYKN